ncbi:winged helix-turn-helix transcriptional regulator [Kineosporia succinea]|uniref:DNA-binding HxlR family transcriptional regulator n=1 Tax=Kineosporia succinea TaxID=84632 RepID=A0ABT9PC19_9ACTN|nr:helix-turn-helix domain-containing protein [Kineosporia succinea]MDP9830243.1 DNA-binding HxlR family transcriptional regulator [Kineosporia succinea]
MDESRKTAARLLSADTFGRTCPSRKVLDQVTSRWGTLVLAVLVTGPHRFAAIRDEVGGISEKMLSQTLKQLVRAGLADRSVDASVPPQVTYTLTEMGTDLATPLYQLVRWVGLHNGELEAAQRQYDARTG